MRRFFYILAMALCGCAGPKFSEVPGPSEAIAKGSRLKAEVTAPMVKSFVVAPVATNVLPSTRLPDGVNNFSLTIPKQGIKHALIYTKDYGATNVVRLFSDLIGWSNATFPGPGISELVAEFVDGGNTLVMTDDSGMVREYDLNQWPDLSSPSGSFFYGYLDDWQPCITRLRNGGLVIVQHRYDYSSTLDIAYRNPLSGAPPPPGQTNSPPLWLFESFILEPYPSGEAPINATVAEIPGTNGSFAVYFNRDGTQQIKRARFYVDGATIGLVDYDGTWASANTFNGAPVDGAMAPDLEFPFVEAVTDWANQRILVSYAQSRNIYAETKCDLVTTRPVVTADLGTNKVLVTTGPDCIDRSTSPSPLFLDKAGNVYCIYDYVDPFDCTYHWKLWKLSADGTAEDFVLTDESGNFVSSAWGHYLGFSCDGYLVTKDNNMVTRLFKLPVGTPRLNIVRDVLPNRVKITWDADATWHLQSTTNFQTWIDLPGAKSGDTFTGDSITLFRLKK